MLLQYRNRGPDTASGAFGEFIDPADAHDRDPEAELRQMRASQGGNIPLSNWRSLSSIRGPCVHLGGTAQTRWNVRWMALGGTAYDTLVALHDPHILVGHTGYVDCLHPALRVQ